ncbi:MAG: hypothetical protein M5U08_24755 [Burkholderiales bacterium]|nr:hypothetical protein [Burkholderiales bacterium]
MQLVAMVHPLVRVEVEPALPARILRPGVPRDRERLDASVGKLDQVLLQWMDAVCVLDLEVGQLPVGSVGAHEKSAVAPEERRLDTGVAEPGAIEIAEHRGFGGVLHRTLVLRAVPGPIRFRMARLALGAADELGLARRGGRCGPRRLPENGDQRTDHEQRARGQREPGDLPCSTCGRCGRARRLG